MKRTILLMLVVILTIIVIVEIVLLLMSSTLFVDQKLEVSDASPFKQVQTPSPESTTTSNEVRKALVTLNNTWNVSSASAEVLYEGELISITDVDMSEYEPGTSKELLIINSSFEDPETRITLFPSQLAVTSVYEKSEKIPFSELASGDEIKVILIFDLLDGKQVDKIEIIKQ